MKFLNFDQTEYLAVKWQDFRIKKEAVSFKTYSLL